MANYFPDIYRQLESEIDTSIKQKNHMLIITLPGLGATHLLQHYLKNHPKNDIKYITTTNQPISDTYNFIDIDNTKLNFINQIETYFNNANFHQKFILIINRPSILKSSQYLNSVLPKRFLKVFYLSAYNQKDTEIFIKDINPNISSTDIKLTYKLSAGIPRLAKFFCTNIKLIHQDQKTYIDDQILNNIISPTISAILETDPDILTKLNIDLKNPIISHFIKNDLNNINIKINFDLTFSEKNNLNPNTLNKIESQILKYMTENNFSISREKVAEFKWGENQYDEFSDLAITKTMRRLKHKLSLYTLKTIPKTGYVITKL